MDTKNMSATALAEIDYQNHIEHGVDLNPFSTAGARYDWQRGFTGAAQRSWEGPLEFNATYQRGKAAAAIKGAQA